jgi:asparagine synthase (glutamine-hydrolysing)
VLVETVAALGVEEALRRTNGMFALAIWDRQERALYLARDRMGEKPLYYGWAGDAFLFGSELKALAVHPKFRRDMDRGAMSLFLQYGYVPNPLCIYRGFAQLEPGHFVRLAFDAAPGQMPQSRPYWDLPEPKPEPADPEEAEETLDRLLRDATRLRMRADVPMGAFLSGGIDSSTVVALMQAQSSDRVRTYSIGFSEAAYDEAGYAKDVAKHLGTLHTEMYVSSDDARDLIPAIPTLYDEPFADSSQLPTYLLCKLTRQHVTVSLSGDAGDELFGGYERYFTFSDRWPLRRRLRPVRPLVAGALDATPALAWQAAARIAPARIRGKITPQRARRYAASFRAATGHDYYRHLMEQWSPNTLRRPPAPQGFPGPRRHRSLRRPVPRHDLRRHGQLSARRYPGEGRSRLDGRQPGVPRAPPRSPDRGIRRHASARPQASRPHRQMAAAPGAGPLCPAGVDRSAEAGLRPADQGMVPRPAARVGRGPAERSRDGGQRAGRPVRRAGRLARASDERRRS